MISAEIISTARLQLRSPVRSDLPILYDRVFSDAEVMRFSFGGLPFDEHRAAAFFESAFDHQQSGLKLGVLVEKASSEVIGFSGLMECAAFGKRDHEIGFVLCRSAWGKGYATEIGQGHPGSTAVARFHPILDLSLL